MTLILRYRSIHIHLTVYLPLARVNDSNIEGGLLTSQLSRWGMHVV
jgi:hypothetical protein